MTFPIIVIIGPTGVGKTDLALALAEQCGAEILSCDSVQVYRGMDIGTAKVTAAERARVPHHGLDLADPDDVFDVARFAAHAHRVIDSAPGPLLAVGGSGFYMKTLFTAVTDNVPIAPETRRIVERFFDREGLPGLLRELDRRSEDPPAPLDRRNHRRLCRALERCLETGKTVEETRRNFAKIPGPFADRRKVTLLLECADDTLDRRLRRRSEEMLRDCEVIQSHAR